MPTTRQPIYVDNGLVLVAADGRRWRIHHETLTATCDTTVAAASRTGTAVTVLGGAAALHRRSISRTCTFAVGLRTTRSKPEVFTRRAWGENRLELSEHSSALARMLATKDARHLWNCG